MDKTTFEELLDRGECKTIDFKVKMYSFYDENQYGKEKAKLDFIKDILAMNNTVRSTKSYIIIGVGEDDKKGLTLEGIDSVIDNSKLQEMIKDSVSPVPDF